MEELVCVCVCVCVCKREREKETERVTEREIKIERGEDQVGQETQAFSQTLLWEREVLNLTYSPEESTRASLPQLSALPLYRRPLHNLWCSRPSPRDLGVKNEKRKKLKSEKCERKIKK